MDVRNTDSQVTYWKRRTIDLFGIVGIRGMLADVTPDLAVPVARATAWFTAGSTSFPPVVVGRDGRTTGGLAHAINIGLESGGASVQSIGCVPTPAVSYESRRRYGVMLTASHNPPASHGQRNQTVKG